MDNHFNPPEKDMFAVVNKYPKTKMVDIEDKLNVSSAYPVAIDSQRLSAPVVPILNRSNISNNTTNYVPHPTSRISSLPHLQEIIAFRLI